MDPGQDPALNCYFTLYDVLDENFTNTRALANFSALTGGDQKISLVTYNVIDPKGNVTTKSMPGQTTFAPVVLLRPMDAYANSLNDKLKDAIQGKLQTLRKNYSVVMFNVETVGDARVATPAVYWHLINAIPSVLDGFSFNARTESNYVDFEITLQAESIEVVFA
jgi:phage tail-like protein